MNRALMVISAAVLAMPAFAQRTVPSTYGSRSGFGSVLFPGTGHAPNTVVNTLPVGGVRGRGGILAPPRVNHPSHPRRVIVPYPVFVGGYYGTGFDTPYYPEPVAPEYVQAPVQQQPPVVIINQSYRPETANPVLRDYSDVPLPEPAPSLRKYDAPVHPTPDPKERAAAAAEAERPTIFLIALNDHTVLPTLAYWIEGDTLHYISRDGQPNRVSLALVDRDFSRQLNRERQVEFKLPN